MVEVYPLRVEVNTGGRDRGLPWEGRGLPKAGGRGLPPGA